MFAFEICEWVSAVHSFGLTKSFQRQLNNFSRLHISAYTIEYMCLISLTSSSHWIHILSRRCASLSDTLSAFTIYQTIRIWKERVPHRNGIHTFIYVHSVNCAFLCPVCPVCVCSPKRMFSRVACLVELQTTSKHDGCNGQSHCSCCLHITNVFVCIYILVEWLLFFLAKLVSLTRTRVKCQKYSTSIHRFEFHSKPHTNFRLRRPPAAKHAVDECDAATNVIESVD